MSVTLRRLVAVLTGTAAVLAVLPAAASADVSIPVAPNQYFVGGVIAVNSTGATHDAVIDVNCAGPAAFGTPAPGQSVEVQLVAGTAGSTAGFTSASGRSIVAELVYGGIETPTVVDKLATFTTYATPAPIPTDIQVPCSGTGEVSFDPMPTDLHSVPYVVSVTFVSSAV